MTEKPTSADTIRAVVEKARAIFKERGGMAVKGGPANDNRRPADQPREPDKPDDR